MPIFISYVMNYPYNVPSSAHIHPALANNLEFTRLISFLSQEGL